MAEIVDGRCVFASFEHSKGKNRQENTTACMGQTLMPVNLCQFPGGLWLTWQDGACKTSPACPEPESTRPGAATAPECFAGEPHREREDSVPAACLWDRISRGAASYRHLDPG